VTKSFGSVHAVRGIDLTIPRGQTVALLGPNGAGKSTLIAMMLGLIAPNAGTISVYGEHPAAAMTAGRVGAMLQDAGFVANATVRELIELARALYPLPGGGGRLRGPGGGDRGRPGGRRRHRRGDPPWPPTPTGASPRSDERGR
jgi:ABC-2 type transport system ATP-binding protein